MKGYFKCRNCRKLLELATDSVCTNHNIALDQIDTIEPNSVDHAARSEREVTCEDNHYFLIDSKLDQINWVSSQLNKDEWTKGKIYCPHNCGSKIGTYNFVALSKCGCGSHTTKPVHLIKSRVDFHHFD